MIFPLCSRPGRAESTMMRRNRMLNCFTTSLAAPATSIVLLPQKKAADWLLKQNEFTKTWLQSVNQVRFEPGSVIVLPQTDGKINRVICCLADERDFWSVA